MTKRKLEELCFSKSCSSEEVCDEAYINSNSSDEKQMRFEKK